MKKIKLIAVLAALIAGLCLYQLLKQISKPAETPRTQIVVASCDIPENTVITDAMVSLQPVATEALLPNYILDPETVVGMVAQENIYCGEQIIKNRLVKVGADEVSSDTLAYVVDPGMRAVTFSVSAVTGVGNMLKPGNHVDLVMTYSYEKIETDDEGNEEKQTLSASRLLLQNIKVLAVDAILSKTGSAEYSTVTLMMTPEDAVSFCLADSTGNIRMLLRSSLDEEVLGEVMIKADDIAVTE